MTNFYTVKQGEIKITDKTHFEPEKILECGQIFRYKKIGSDYEIIADYHRCLLINKEDCVIIQCDDVDYFIKYFDLDRDYNEICKNISTNYGFEKEIEFGKGLRLLVQNPFEMIISFIISANNHIPRIKSIIDRICTTFGKDMGGYYAFPTPEDLAKATEEDMYSLGCGYRAPYIVSTARAISKNGEFDTFFAQDDQSLRRSLCKYKGVGGKVADCIMLFAYARYRVFPVDTWIVQAYGRDKKDGEKLRLELTEKYGELSGFIQQYVYYYKRSNPEKNISVV